MKKINTYKEALKKFFIIEETRDYSLEKMKIAMNKLSNPLEKIKVIHITGTNGKGSTCKMCFSVLKHAGKKVGCFTSPHLIDIKERFITEIGEITEDEFVECLNKILALELHLSFFEKATLMSFLFFQSREVEYAIVEVGFGGLLDSTNIVEPIITAITSIGFDHIDVLGNTLDEISFHKAGIIKQGIPIIYNHKNAVIEKTAEDKKSKIIFTNEQVETNLLGEYQGRNAAIAFEITRYLGIDVDIINQGLQKTVHSGRLQEITNNLIIDGAHNEQGLLELKKFIESVGGSFYAIELCFAQKRGKNAEKILEVFGDKYFNYTLVKSSNDIMVEKSDILKERIIENVNIKNTQYTFQVKSPHYIYAETLQNSNTLYIVFGSLYMVGEFLKFVSK